jgi:hypothetical protein
MNPFGNVFALGTALCDALELFQGAGLILSGERAV